MDDPGGCSQSNVISKVENVYTEVFERRTRMCGIIDSVMSMGTRVYITLIVIVIGCKMIVVAMGAAPAC